MLRRSTSASASHIEAVRQRLAHARNGRCGRRTANSLRRGRGAASTGLTPFLPKCAHSIATCREQSIGNYIPFFDDRAGRGGSAGGQAGSRHLRPSTASLAIASGVVSAGSLRKRTASAARFCSSAIRRTQRRPRKHSSPPSPSRNSRRRGASSCARRCRWRSFINRPAAPPTRTPFSRLRSKAFRRRRNFPEIEEAQALLAALAETDEVKNAAAARQRRLKLQTSYGQALMRSRGYQRRGNQAAFAAPGNLPPGSRIRRSDSQPITGSGSGASCAASWRRCGRSPKIFLREAREAAGSPEAGSRLRSGRDLIVAREFQRGASAPRTSACDLDPERDREPGSASAWTSACSRRPISRAYLAAWRGRPGARVDGEMVARRANRGHVANAWSTRQFQWRF